jgi:hypothetical protein
MIRTLLASIIPFVFLTACGSFVENSDKPLGPYLSAPEISGDFGVNELENAPSGDVVILEGISCKNRLWDSAPTEERAVSVLKREVKEAGYNSVYIVSVNDDAKALMKNCWSAIKATGIAAK